MYEIVWQYDENMPQGGSRPDSPDQAREQLVEGNRQFARLFGPSGGDAPTRQVIRVSPQDVGLGPRPGEAPPQVPYAAFLSCADARVPVELIFGQKANDLFVVRVAGNVLGDECLGSLDFAVGKLGTVRLLTVMGHTGCGAVTAAVDAYLEPAGYLGVAANFPLQSIVSDLMPPTRSAAHALGAVHGQGAAGRPGYREALIETTVILNAAINAAVLAQTFRASLGERLDVAFGVYNLLHRTVGLPALDGSEPPWQEGLHSPPRDPEALLAFGAAVAGSRFIRDLLDA